MLRIRAAEIDDVPVMLGMLEASARDQGFPGEVVVTDDDLRRDGFGANPRFRTLMAEVDGPPVGLALFFITYSTWGSRLVLYLEDLYVAPGHRRAGVGRALLERLAVIALEEGCGRFQWIVHRDNQSAIGAYAAFGAEQLEDWTLMSIASPELDAIAERVRNR